MVSHQRQGQLKNDLDNHQTEWTSFNNHTETRLTNQNGQIKQMQDETARAHTVYQGIIMQLKERVYRLTLQIEKLEEQSLAPSLQPIKSNDIEFEELVARVTDMEKLVNFMNRERGLISTPYAEREQRIESIENHLVKMTRHVNHFTDQVVQQKQQRHQYTKCKYSHPWKTYGYKFMKSTAI
jgi:hypothetical protein